MILHTTVSWPWCVCFSLWKAGILKTTPVFSVCVWISGGLTAQLYPAAMLKVKTQCVYIPSLVHYTINSPISWSGFSVCVVMVTVAVLQPQSVDNVRFSRRRWDPSAALNMSVVSWEYTQNPKIMYIVVIVTSTIYYRH